MLEQPDVHSKYRALFSAVDRFNKLALSQKNSVQYAVRTEKWRTRFWMATLAISECNAWLAHVHRANNAGENETIGRTEWKLQLAEALVNNPWSSARQTRNRTALEDGLGSILEHDLSIPRRLASGPCMRPCKWCPPDNKKRTNYYCSCGEPVCNPSRTDSHCWLVHQLVCTESSKWH